MHITCVINISLWFFLLGHNQSAGTRDQKHQEQPKSRLLIGAISFSAGGTSVTALCNYHINYVFKLTLPFLSVLQYSWSELHEFRFETGTSERQQPTVSLWAGNPKLHNNNLPDNLHDRAGLLVILVTSCPEKASSVWWAYVLCHCKHGSHCICLLSNFQDNFHKCMK